MARLNGGGGGDTRCTRLALLEQSCTAGAARAAGHRAASLLPGARSHHAASRLLWLVHPHHSPSEDCELWTPASWRRARGCERARAASPRSWAARRLGGGSLSPDSSAWKKRAGTGAGRRTEDERGQDSCNLRRASAEPLNRGEPRARTAAVLSPPSPPRLGQPLQLTWSLEARAGQQGSVFVSHLVSGERGALSSRPFSPDLRPPMARMGLAGSAGRWWGLALGLTAFFLPGKRVPPLPFYYFFPIQWLPGAGAGWRARLCCRE